ncbi:hypothetical protein BGW41_004996 [Actinomortierella wolfii]|nr:hypothetical protein BGW41_004996 [Actinomortierella wolfii]
MKVPSLLQLSTTLALCVAAAQAADPGPTMGHTAVLVDNTIFIQGGQSAPNTPQPASFSILLGENGSMNGAQVLDITAFSKFSARDFHVAVGSNAGRLISCGTMNGAKGDAMTCDVFHVRSYRAENLASMPGAKHAPNRGGMAVAVGPESAYLMGGSNGETYSKVVNLLKRSSDLGWRVDVDMPQPVRFHTATYVDSSIGIVVLGGQIQGGSAVAMNTASILKDAVWTNRTIGGENVPARWGHTAVLVKNELFIYGGISTVGGSALADVYALDTKAATWAWRKVAVQAEPRAFHTSTLLPDGTILNMFGTSGTGIEQAVATLSSFNPSSNSWTAMTLPPAKVADASPIKGPGMLAADAVPLPPHPRTIVHNDLHILAAPATTAPIATKTNAPPPAPTVPASTAPAAPSASFGFPNGVIVQTPNGNAAGNNTGNTIFNLPTGTQPFVYPFPTDTSNNPNDPNFKHPTGEEPAKSNTGLIAGVSVAAVVVLVVAGLLFQRYRRRSREAASTFSRQNRSASAAGTAPHSADERNGGKGGVSRSFTIRKPASVNYIEDDSELDQTGHPRYKTDGDAHNHPYYGDRTPGLVEYELSDTSGQKYGPSSVAERKRYVEQQQRKVMEEYEMSFQDYHPPSSPYPQSTAAPSYTSHVSPVQTPTMGGRSPRVQNQQQHQGIQQQYGGYADY